MTVNNETERMLGSFDNLRADPGIRSDYDAIGKNNIRRIDGYEKAAGQAKYTLDVNLPGMLYGRFLTSPFAHAEIIELDTSAAGAFPGVRAILRYDDPELPPAADLGGHGTSSVPVLPAVAHFQGEEIGVFIAADSEEIAENALKKVKVKWKERSFMLDPELAMQPGAALTNPEASPKANITQQNTYTEKLGDIEKGFAEAEKIIEFKFSQNLNTWIGPERPCGVFRWNGEYPEVWVKHQRPHIAKRAISSWFGGIPMKNIDLHCLYQGASFGGWSQMAWNMGGHYCAAVVARRTGRPVMWIFDRREDFYGGEMDEGVYYFKVGFKLDGTITAVQEHGIVTNQAVPVFGIVRHMIENTSIPHIYGKTDSVKINKGPTVPTRCEYNAACHSLTMVFSRVAAELGMDPIELALKNDGAEGHNIDWLNRKKAELGFQPIDSLKECVERGKKAIDWDKKWHRPGMARLANGKLQGLGFVWTHEWEDSGGSGEIAIYIERNDGTAVILGCRADVGVNAETAYCQVAAEELGMRMEDVRYKAQIDAGFYAMTPDTSTNLSINAGAVRNCSRILKARILELAVSPRAVTQLTSFPPAFPGKNAEDLDIKESIIFEKADPSNRMSIAEFIGPSGGMGPLTPVMGEPGLSIGAGLKYPLRLTPPLFEYGWHVQRGAYLGVRLRFCRQAHFIEVEVDPETGQIDIVHVVTVNDVGKVINWDGCQGQQYGGAIMAAGRGCSEEVIHDPNTGVMLNGNILNYKIPTLMDVGPIDTLLVESGMGYGPYGTVGIGEDVATAMPAIIAPAVYNATGKWIASFPITPDKVLKALGKA